MLKIKKYSLHRKNSRSLEMRPTGVVWGAGARLAIAALLLMTAGVASADYTVGSGGDAWSGNSTFDNTTQNQGTGNIELRQEVDDYISYWRADGNGKDDNRTSANDGTANGNAVASATGKYKNAFGLDGTGDYYDVGSSSKLDLVNFTISAWINTNDVSVQQLIFNRGTWGANGYYFQIEGSKLELTTSTGSAYTTNSIANPFNSNEWVHVVATKDGTTVKLFVNTTEVTYTAQASHQISSFSGSAKIGAYSNNGINWNGEIDDVRIYDRVLTSSEINLIYNQSKYTSGNLTTWHDALINNETYQIDVNATGNYSISYNNNDSGMPNVELGNFTAASFDTWNNQSITIAPNTKYQDAIINATLFGNTTATSTLYAITFFTQAASEASVCSITGTNYSTSADVTISNTSVWSNCNLTLPYKITITSNGSLMLNKSTISFDNSSIINNIDITGGILSTKNGSVITATADNWWRLHSDDVGLGTSKVQMNDTTISRVNINLRQTSTGGDVWMDNISMTDWNPTVGAGGVKGAIYIDTFSCINILNSNFTDVNYSEDYQDFVMYFQYTGGCNPSITVQNNTFRDGAQAIVTNDLTGQNGIKILNNYIYNFSQTYVFDFLDGSDYSNLTGNYMEHVAGAFVFNGANDNITIKDNLVNNTNAVFGSNCLSLLGTSNITIRNHTCVNTYYGINPSIMTKGPGNYITVSDSNISATGSGLAGISIYANNSAIDNNSFSSTAVSSYGIDTHPITPIKTITNNVTFTNNTINSSDIGIKVTAATNYKFIDNNITSVDFNIKMDVNTSDIKFINNKYNNNNISFTDNTSRFDSYYYSDILVQDSSNNPIDSATVTTSNLNTSDYPSIARNGTNLTSFTTDASGHTPLPIGNDSTTMVLMNISKNSTVQTNMSYALNVNESSYIYPNINTSINSTGYYTPNEPVTSTTVTPNSSWYRSVPNTYKNTTTITLPQSTNWSILPDNTININASSDKNLTATWSGSATVLFNTTILEWSSQVLYLNHDGVLVDTKSSNATGFVNFTYTGTNGEFNVSVDAGESNFIPPSPISLANTTGNFWVNYTWAAGAGNITDSFNVSHNGTWTNGSAINFSNNSVGAGNWSNITVFGRNSSGTGTLSTGSISQNTQAPSVTSGTSGPESINSTVTRYTIYWQWLNPTEASYNTTRIYINGEFIANQTATNYLLQNLQPQSVHTLSLRSVNTTGENSTWVNSTATTLTPDTGGGSGGGGGGAYIYTPKETNETNISNPIVAQTTIIAKQQPQVQLSDVSKRQLLFGSAIALLLFSIFIFIKPRR